MSRDERPSGVVGGGGGGCGVFFFFFNDTATTEIYTLSLHDALPILIPNSHIQPEGGGFGRCLCKLSQKESEFRSLEMEPIRNHNCRYVFPIHL